MSRRLKILTCFREQYLKFISILQEQFPEQPDLVAARVFFENQVPVQAVLNAFTQHILPLKDMIARRDEEFFIKGDNIFGMLDMGKVIHFKKLWMSERLDQEDRKAIWQWFDKFCELVEMYHKEISS